MLPPRPVRLLLQNVGSVRRGLGLVSQHLGILPGAESVLNEHLLNEEVDASTPVTLSVFKTQTERELPPLPLSSFTVKTNASPGPSTQVSSKSPRLELAHTAWPSCPVAKHNRESGARGREGMWYPRQQQGAQPRGSREQVPARQSIPAPTGSRVFYHVCVRLLFSIFHEYKCPDPTAGLPGISEGEAERARFLKMLTRW